jgi:Tol biopolymer transport system component
MHRVIALAAALAAVVGITPSRGAADTPRQSAWLAWERGDYVQALTTYLDILQSPEADAALEEIALQTGELFHTTELTSEGLAPDFAPGGRWIAYETGSGAARRLRLLHASPPYGVATELTGFGGAFSPDGATLAYVKVTATPDAQPLVVRDLATGAETVLESGVLRKSSLVFGAGVILFAGTAAEGGTQVYSAGPGQPVRALTSGPGDKQPLGTNADGTAVLFTVRTGGGRGGGRGGAAGGPAAFGIVHLPEGRVTMVDGSSPSFSADGSSLVYVNRAGADFRIMAAPAADPSKAAVVRTGAERVDAPALSPDGSRIVFQMMPKEDWELFAIGRDGTGESRLSREIQHDVLPRFLTAGRILATVGEARHRRSYIYDLATRARTRLFHNNTIRTIAPEYAWTASADGSKILIVAEGDGDTVSPERGVYLVDLDRRVTRAELQARLRAQLETERALQAKARQIYAPIAAAVRRVVAEASVERVFAYEKALYDFDSKHITRPGNRLASAYLFEQYTSFGYTPEYQWFAGRGALGGQTANVVATLKGTVNPELVYVVSSHYDSTAAGPGADDDTSGTAALLETARILAAHPLPATVVFASFTGEESGLLGSREWVKRAVADKLKLVGALNNDMIGWANDQRLDNTIRYSNRGIRDVQHAAAIQFTNMITYDALYYKGTDAAAYYEAFGDIVGGIGSYPVLGNPHYHQAHDLLDTINHQLVTEVAKTTAATLMLLASSPSRLANLEVTSFANSTATVTWTRSPEKNITGYLVAYGPPDKPEAQQVRVTGASATLKRVAAGTVVSVKAVNARGLEGWDWARVTID